MSGLPSLCHRVIVRLAFRCGSQFGQVLAIHRGPARVHTAREVAKRLWNVPEPLWHFLGAVPRQTPALQRRCQVAGGSHHVGQGLACSALDACDTCDPGAGQGVGSHSCWEAFLSSLRRKSWSLRRVFIHERYCSASLIKGRPHL